MRTNLMLLVIIVVLSYLWIVQNLFSCIKSCIKLTVMKEMWFVSYCGMTGGWSRPGPAPAEWPVREHPKHPGT